MELFRDFRLRMGNSILSRKLERTKRKVSYTDIQHISTIGIVWNASFTGDFNVLSKFHQTMNERGITVSILGYYPGKELPDQYTAQRFLTCLRKNDLSWLHIPTSEVADKFINTKYDILIDINFDNLLPLAYITSLSKASFKVGLFGNESAGSAFDLMIELKKPVKTEEYLANTIHYLEMIKSGTKEQSERTMYEKV